MHGEKTFGFYPMRIRACGGKGADDGQIPRFPYMPRVLKYIVSELLKNRCRATTDMLSAHELEAADFPINVINFCADEDHMTICVTWSFHLFSLFSHDPIAEIMHGSP